MFIRICKSKAEKAYLEFYFFWRVSIFFSFFFQKLMVAGLPGTPLDPAQWLVEAESNPGLAHVPTRSQSTEGQPALGRPLNHNPATKMDAKVKKMSRVAKVVINSTFGVIYPWACITNLIHAAFLLKSFKVSYISE